MSIRYPPGSVMDARKGVIQENIGSDQDMPVTTCSAISAPRMRKKVTPANQ